MIKNNKKVIKKVIYCLVLLVLTLILKSKVTYAVTITYYPNMEVYTTKEFFVKNTTKAGEWSVYTLKTGTNINPFLSNAFFDSYSIIIPPFFRATI